MFSDAELDSVVNKIFVFKIMAIFHGKHQFCFDAPVLLQTPAVQTP